MKSGNDMYKKYRRKQMDFFNYNLYKDIPAYEGTDTFYARHIALRIESIVLIVLFSLPSLALTYLFYKNSDTYSSTIFSILALLTISSFGYLAVVCHRKATINENGVFLISYNGKTIKFFEWDNIEHIHVLISLGSNSKSQTKFYISTDPLKIYGLGKKTASSPEYMVISYRPEIIHCIIKYWDRKIDNYDDSESWHKYINKKLTEK